MPLGTENIGTFLFMLFMEHTVLRYECLMKMSLLWTFIHGARCAPLRTFDDDELVMEQNVIVRAHLKIIKILYKFFKNVHNKYEIN